MQGPGQPPHVALMAPTPASPCLLPDCRCRRPVFPYAQNYFDNRYWTMWKLPMFGCTDPIQVRPSAQSRSALHCV